MGLVEQLRAALGPADVLTDAADTAPYLTDWRRRYTGSALAVLRPRDTAAVAQAVRLCAQAGVPIVPQGGNTGLVGGATPDGSGRAVVISLRRLDRIRAVDPANDTITVEAGCLLRTIQEAAAAHDRLFPLSLAAEGSCTIGGNLSTNAGGTQVLRYGNTRELTLGLEVVLPDGQVWDGLRGLRKDNTGYDLKHLFIGAEGTLGVITAAVLKLFAQPAGRLAAFAALAGLDAALALLQAMRRAAGPTLTAFELMSARSLKLVQEEFPGERRPLPPTAPWYVLLELSDHEGEAHAAAVLEAALGTAASDGIVLDAAVSRSLADAAGLWRWRELIPEAQARRGGNVKHDVSLPVSAIPAFVAETDAALSRAFEGLQVFAFGHLGDGNLHYNVGTRAGTPVAYAFEHQEAVNRLVHDAVHRHGGSISAEHGLGQLKRELIGRYKPALELELMRGIKRSIDPQGLMNPGKVL